MVAGTKGVCLFLQKQVMDCASLQTNALHTHLAQKQLIKKRAHPFTVNQWKVTNKTHSHRTTEVLQFLYSLLGLLVGFLSFHCRTNAGPYFRVEQRSQEHHGCSHPMPDCEGITEVQDGNNEAQKFAQRHHQCDRERRALCGQNKDAADTHVSGKPG